MSKVKLEWNVLMHDFSVDKIIKYNVLDDTYIIDSIKKAVRKKDITTFNELKEFLCKKFRARYWSRTEYEILVSGLFNKDKVYKIDAWYQIEMNLDNITEYVINKLKLDVK